jgi:hypothetical protein
MPQPNGFGVFGNDQMLRQNLMGAGVTATGGLPDMEWGLREERKRQTDKILNMSEQDFGKWLGSQSTGPGSWGAEMIQARRRQQSGIPPGAIQVPPSWSEKGWTKGGWKLPDGTMWDPSMGPAPKPREYPWSSPKEAPKKDWFAINDFLKTVGFGSNFRVDQALEYPDMVNESFTRDISIEGLTPKMKAQLEKAGYKVKTSDSAPGYGSIKFESGVGALQGYKKLKELGIEGKVNKIPNIVAMKDSQVSKAPEPAKETKVSKETNKVLTKALFG